MDYNDIASFYPDPDGLLSWPDQPLNDPENAPFVLTPEPNCNWVSTYSHLNKDRDTEYPLGELDMTLSFRTSRPCEYFYRAQHSDEDYVPGFRDLLPQSPSVTLSSVHGDLEADLGKPPLSNTLPNSFSSKPFWCDHCNKSFSQRSQLRKHQKIHNKNDRKHCCNKCDLCFHYRKDLRRHRRAKHQLFDGVFRGYTCPINGCQIQKLFTRRDKFKEHVQKQHPFIFKKESSKGDTTVGTSVSRTDQIGSNPLLEPFRHIKAEPTSQQDANKKHNCPFQDCDKTDGFTSRVDLCRHLRSVHTTRLFADSNGFFKCAQEACNNSTKIYSRKDNFKRHVTTVHGHVDHIEDLIERSKYVPHDARVIEPEDSCSFLPVSSYRSINDFQTNVRLAASFRHL